MLKNNAKNTWVEYVFGKVASLQHLLCIKMDCIKNTSWRGCKNFMNHRFWNTCTFTLVVYVLFRFFFENLIRLSKTIQKELKTEFLILFLSMIGIVRVMIGLVAWLNSERRHDLQDLLLIWAVLMSCQGAKQLLSTGWSNIRLLNFVKLSTLLIKKGSHKQYATLTTLAVVWAL